jgi:hypothetical protein
MEKQFHYDLDSAVSVGIVITDNHSERTHIFFYSILTDCNAILVSTKFLPVEKGTEEM